MAWWSDFDRREVDVDQPAPDEVDRRMLDRLAAVAGAAAGAGFALVPTLSPIT